MMKKIEFTVKVMLALMIIGVAFTGCSTNESEDAIVQEEDTSEVVLSSEVDEATESLDILLLEIYENQEDSETRMMNPPPLPDCVTVTVVFQQGFREVTIDFGTDGCLIRGHVYRGRIIMTYERNLQAQEIFISCVLEDYYFDNKNIIGSNTILRQLSNDNGNPQFTHTRDITIIWPNGVQASRDGQKVREWIEGFGSGVFSDNVFEVTGYWISTFVNGNSHSYEIMTPLRREVICRYFVSGNVDVERTNFGGTFDYGEGNCDNEATFTFNNGTVIDVILN